MIDEAVASVAPAFEKVLTKQIKAGGKAALSGRSPLAAIRKYDKELRSNYTNELLDSGLTFAAANYNAIRNSVNGKSAIKADPIGRWNEDSRVTVSKTIREWMDTYTGKRIKLIDDYTKEWVERVAREVTQLALEGGLGIHETQKLFDERWKEAKGFRAERIARTELLPVHNRGAIEGWKLTGVVTKKEWLSTSDFRTRPSPKQPKANPKWDHRKANGQIVDADKDFTVSGEKLSFPGDPKGSAANVIMCRCTVLPVVDNG